jgi:hypothetical protein
VDQDSMIDRAINEAEQSGDSALTGMLQEGKKKMKQREPLLYLPIGANATTFEALTQTMAGSVRRHPWKRLNSKTQATEAGVYSHCSLCFGLAELSSLVKARSENIVNFFTDIYDCKDPYKYVTKHSGIDVIFKPCLNLIAGTTLAYMQDIFNDRILNDGYASRSWFVWASKPRFFKMFFSHVTPEQDLCRDLLLKHIGRLIKVYGEVTFSPEATEHLTHFWEVKMFNGSGRINKSPKLDYYYGRKNIHTLKHCMQQHFAEVEIDDEGQCSMEIQLPTVIRALASLDKIEGRMHEALQFGAANPLYRPMKKVVAYLETNGPTQERDLMVEFWADLPPPASETLERILEYLMADDMITKEMPTAGGSTKKGYLIKLVEKKSDNNGLGDLPPGLLKEYGCTRTTTFR